MITPCSLNIKMLKSFHEKTKQRLALARRIELSNRLAQQCSHCSRQLRSCFIDLSLSQRCSECVRAKKPCDSKGYRVTRVRAQVCRFFCGKTQPRPVVPDVPQSPSQWFPAFGVGSFVPSELLTASFEDVDFSNSEFLSWATEGIGDETAEASRGS